MKTSRVSLVVAVVALCYMTSVFAQLMDCAGGDGECRETNDGGDCQVLPGNCTQGFTCCEKDDTLTKRHCVTKPKCSDRGGACGKIEDKTCKTFTVDDLCNRPTCTCCLSDDHRCGSSKECNDKGGICVKGKKNAKKFCVGGKIHKNGCGKNSCRCCIPH